VNHVHREESENPFCEVKANFEHEGKQYAAKHVLSLKGGRISQALTIDAVLDRLMSPGTFPHVCLNSFLLEFGEEEFRNLPCLTRTKRTIQKHLDLNLKAGIGFAVLDGAFEPLRQDDREKLLDFLGAFPMYQLIVMARGLPTKPLHVTNVKIHPSFHPTE